MLTAKTTGGKLICLGGDHNKSALLHLKSEEKFYCPICGSRVLLKLGDHRIYHFAHESDKACKIYFERETMYHMEGKLQLYQWLTSQGVPAELEWYDPEIQQRADVMFCLNGIKYALEFQCSPIPEQIFTKRTNAYTRQGYVPIWILGNKHIKVKRRNIFEFSDFDYSFLTKSKNGQYYIPSYCPKEKFFQILSPIVPFTIKMAFSNSQQIHSHSFSIEELIEPMVNNQFHFRQWTMELEKSNLHLSLRPSSAHYHFLREIYTRSLNPFLLPPEIGLPLRHSFLIQTPPLVWQTYVYMDVLQHKENGGFFTLNDADNCFFKRIKKKDIIVRKLPQFSHVPRIVIKEYFQILVKIGVIEERKLGVYQVQTSLIVPNSNSEKEKRHTEFFQKYHQILSKI